MRKLLMASAISLLLPAAATAQMTPNATIAPTASGQLSTQDQNFVKQAAMSGMAEVQEGQLAQSKGDIEVQSLGAHMVADHTKANDQLKGITRSLDVALPLNVSAKQTAMITKLQNASGTSAFDSAYLSGQKTAHLKAIKVFETEISTGSNPQLKTFATTTLPILKMHLAMVEAATP